MHFPYVSDFPPVSEKFYRLRRKVSQFYLFPKNSRFSSANISDDLFFSHRLQILIFSPIFAVSIHFPPISRKLLFHPTFHNFTPCFPKIYGFLNTLCFSFPPSLTMMHFMHHTMHVLDAPASKILRPFGRVTVSNKRSVLQIAIVVSDVTELACLVVGEHLATT